MTRHFFDTGAQARYTEARLAAIRSLGKLAQMEDCAFVLVCGDVFESNQLSPRTIARAMDTMRGIPVPVYLLPRNHDPLNAASIYRSEEFQRRCPEHVHVMDEPGPQFVDAGVELVAAPWHSKRPLRDLVGDQCAALAPTRDVVRIIAGHGAVDSVAYTGDNPATIRIDALRVALEERRVHYVALGDLRSLTSDPVSGLGDDAFPTSVRFQASSFSPDDDLVVEGRTADDGSRRVSIGVGRDSALAAGDTALVPLIRSYLQVVTEHWNEATDGRWWLVLAVASTNRAVQQGGVLATIAHAASNTHDFHAVVARPRATPPCAMLRSGTTGSWCSPTNDDVRGRLGHLDSLVTNAIGGASRDAHERTWRLLSALLLREFRLEGADESDRTGAVASLRKITADRSVSAGDALFGKLAELSTGYAPSAAHATGVTLRRDLSGTPLAASPSYRRAWSALDGCAQRLPDGIRPDLAADGVRVELPRDGERAARLAAMATVGQTSGSLIDIDEPDVGKLGADVAPRRAVRTSGCCRSCLESPRTTAVNAGLRGPAQGIRGRRACLLCSAAGPVARRRRHRSGFSKVAAACSGMSRSLPCAVASA